MPVWYGLTTRIYTITHTWKIEAEEEEDARSLLHKIEGEYPEDLFDALTSGLCDIDELRPWQPNDSAEIDETYPVD